jgi:predicted DNA-binding transcriptional regulator AlpA
MKKKIRGLRLKQLLERVPFSTTTVDRLEAKGQFPKRVHFGRMVFWVETEVDSYLANLTTREKGSGSHQQPRGKTRIGARQQNAQRQPGARG